MTPAPWPSSWCTLSLGWATAAFALGWLLWAPAAIAGVDTPRLVRWLAVALATAGVVLSVGVSTWACVPCGGGG